MGSAHAQSAPVETLTLAEALRVARASHPLRREAEAATELSRGVAMSTRAALLPQLSATLGYQRTTSNYVFRPGNNANFLMTIPPNSNRTFNFYNLALTVTQLLYDFGRSLGEYRAARDNAEAQNLDEQTTLLSIEFNVRNAYFTARANQASLAVAEQTLRNQERHRDQIAAFVRAETRPEIDLAQARVDVANARVQWIQADGALQESLAALNQAMGVERTTAYQIAEDGLPELPEENATADVLLGLAAAERPELRVLALQGKAQRSQVRATKAQNYPSISSSATFTDAGTDLGKLTWNWNAGATLSWNPWQGGLVKGNLRQARANLASIDAQLAVLRQQVLLQLEQARLAIRSNRAVAEAANEVVENARLRLGLAEGRYEHGVGEVIELADAQLALTTAEYQEVQAEYNLAIARAQLLNALGRPQ
jgi:outer membrane protein